MELTTETKIFLSLLYFDALFSDNKYIQDVNIMFYGNGEYRDDYKEQKERIIKIIVKLMEENPELIVFGILLNDEYVKKYGNSCYNVNTYKCNGEKVNAFLKKHEKIIDWNKIVLDKPFNVNIMRYQDNELYKLEMMLNSVYSNLKKKKEEEEEETQQLQQQNELLEERINVITDELMELKKQVGKLLSIQNQPVDLLNFNVEENETEEINHGEINHGEINQA